MSLRRLLCALAALSLCAADGLDGVRALSEAHLARRAALGRRIADCARELGMSPVFQAFWGMVPTDFPGHQPGAKVHAQGLWCQMERPALLDPADPRFAPMARDFYDIQARRFGPARHFAGDPFHEGGNHGIEADLDAWVAAFFEARRAPEGASLRGFGLTMEGYAQHPLVYELFLDLPWMKEAPDMKAWLAAAVTRRYGRAHPAALRAWELVRTSALASRLPGVDPDEAQVPTGTVLTGRPTLRHTPRGRTWTTERTGYEAAFSRACGEVEKAFVTAPTPRRSR